MGGFLLFMGATKFSGRAHIFPYIEYKAAAGGIPFAEHAFPVGNLATGALEILAGLLVIIPPIRQLGAKLAVLPFLGAVVFHLTPLLGVVTPTGFADPKPVEALAAGGPFDASHFATTESNALFMMAAGGLIAAIINLIVQRNV
ncbi:MAG: hypothetical protein HKN14_00850 [Marinicaulis sp.]|nr:hypothetical protein [Marinicaulis sp.]